jgi:hypothetical protein
MWIEFAEFNGLEFSEESAVPWHSITSIVLESQVEKSCKLDAVGESFLPICAAEILHSFEPHDRSELFDLRRKSQECRFSGDCPRCGLHILQQQFSDRSLAKFAIEPRDMGLDGYFASRIFARFPFFSNSLKMKVWTFLCPDPGPGWRQPTSPEM